MAKETTVKAAPRPRKKVVPNPVVSDDVLPPVIEAGATSLSESSAAAINPIVEAVAPADDVIETVAADSAPTSGAEDMASAADKFTFATDLGAEKAKAFFEDATTKLKDTFEKSTKSLEDVTELTKGNVEALVASGRAAAKGTEAILQDVASYSRTSFETASSALKTFAAAKSPTELFQLQSEYAKTSFDSAVAEASKVSEAYVKLMSDVFAPITGRVQLATEKFKATIS